MMSGDFYIVRTAHHLDNAVKSVQAIVPSVDHPMAVKVEPFKAKRSELQNRYLWGWHYAKIVHYLQEVGTVIHCDDGEDIDYTAEILHEIFRGKFLIRDTITAVGNSGESKTLTLYYSTTELNTKQYSDFIDNVTQFVWQFWQFNIPPGRGLYDQWAEELGIKKAA